VGVAALKATRKCILRSCIGIGDMNKFRKKSVVIEAVQYDGNNVKEVNEFVKGAGTTWFTSSPMVLCIPTLEGEMRAYPRDWIIKGIKGEFYPCKPDIFEATYETVEEHLSECGSS
jgi:hypothetical protein